jgi:hypothetical protein
MRSVIWTQSRHVTYPWICPRDRTVSPSKGVRWRRLSSGSSIVQGYKDPLYLQVSICEFYKAEKSAFPCSDLDETVIRANLTYECFYTPATQHVDCESVRGAFEEPNTLTDRPWHPPRLTRSPTPHADEQRGEHG